MGSSRSARSCRSLPRPTMPMSPNAPIRRSSPRERSRSRKPWQQSIMAAAAIATSVGVVSLRHAVLVPTRKPLRIFRHMLSVSMNYFIPEAPVTRLVVASKAAFIFSLTIKFASRRALLPPRISSIIRSAIATFDSAANKIKGLNISCASRVTRRMVRNCSGSARQN